MSIIKLIIEVELEGSTFFNAVAKKIEKVKNTAQTTSINIMDLTGIFILLAP